MAKVRIHVRPGVAAVEHEKRGAGERLEDVLLEERHPQASVRLALQRLGVEIREHAFDQSDDFGSRRGLLRLIGKRRRLQSYLQRIDRERYARLIQDAGGLEFVYRDALGAVTGTPAVPSRR